MEQKKLRIWTLFMQWQAFISTYCVTLPMTKAFFSVFANINKAMNIFNLLTNLFQGFSLYYFSYSTCNFFFIGKRMHTFLLTIVNSQRTSNEAIAKLKETSDTARCIKLLSAISYFLTK